MSLISEARHQNPPGIFNFHSMGQVQPISNKAHFVFLRRLQCSSLLGCSLFLTDGHGRDTLDICIPPGCEKMMCGATNIADNRLSQQGLIPIGNF